MHPNKFFNEVNLRTGIDTFEIFDGDLKQKLSELHPLNFIKTKITLPIYQIKICYFTDSGNYKKANKYIRCIFCTFMLAVVLITASCSFTYTQNIPTEAPAITSQPNTGNDAAVSLDSIPEYNGSPYIAINDNVPFFKAYANTSFAE